MKIRQFFSEFRKSFFLTHHLYPQWELDSQKYYYSIWHDMSKFSKQPHPKSMQQLKWFFRDLKASYQHEVNFWLPMATPLHV